MASNELTPKEREVLTFIIEYVRTHGYAPTTREAALGLDGSPSLFRLYVKRLRDKGYVNAVHGSSRTITVLKSA